MMHQLIVIVLFGYVSNAPTSDNNPPASLTLSNKIVSDYTLHDDHDKTAWFAKFLSECDTIFIINGYVSNEGPIFITTVNNLLAVNDTCYNIVRVRWTESYNPDYTVAAKAIVKVGKYLCSIILEINEATNILQKQLQLTGHSLGAHIAGVTGRCVQKKRSVDLLHGLDPAGPCFTSYLDLCDMSAYQLRATDGQLVVSLQTNGGDFGTTATPGKVGFVANGGEYQPGCLDPMCSHTRAIKYYNEAILSQHFIATSDDGVQTIYGRSMPGSTPDGVYYFTTPDNALQV